jgi:hypothetical protein
MKHRFVLPTILATVMALAQNASKSSVPAYHHAPAKPGKKLPPILTERELVRNGFSLPVQKNAYKAAARESSIIYPRDPEGMWAARSDGLAAVAEQIELLNRMQSSPVAEITAPTAIASLAWQDSHLLILASDGRVYAIDRSIMREDSSRSSLTGILLKPADAIVQPGPNTQWSTIQSELWTGSNRHIYSYTDSGVFEAGHGFWTKAKSEPFANLSILSIARSSSSSMMTIWTGDLLKITDPVNPVESTDSELIVIKNGDTIAARRSLSQLQAEVVSRAGRELATLDTAAVNRDAIWLSMWSVDDMLSHFSSYNQLGSLNAATRRPSFRGVILGRGTETVLPGRLPIRKTLRRLGYESRARQLNFTPSIILATHSIVVLCSSSRMVAGEAVAEVAAELGFEQ